MNLGPQAATLLSHTQMRENGATFNIDYTPSQDPYDISFPYIELNGTILPLQLRGGTLTLRIRRPTEDEYNDDQLLILNLTAPFRWTPSEINYPEVDQQTYNRLVT